MIVYFDICCLKRPFDDQTRPRIALETVAVLTLLDAVAEGELTAVRSVAHALENACNPDRRRAAFVASWLSNLNPLEVTPPTVVDQVRRLEAAGLHRMDAFHVAWAEHLQADALITTDDRLLSWAARHDDIARVRVVDPLAFVREVSK